MLFRSRRFKELGRDLRERLAAAVKAGTPFEEAVTAAGASSDSTLRLAALPIATRLSPEAAAPVLENLVTFGSVAEKKRPWALANSMARLSPQGRRGGFADGVDSGVEVHPGYRGRNPYYFLAGGSSSTFSGPIDVL